MRTLINLPSLKFLWEEMVRTFLRFPFAILVSIAAAVYAIAVIEMEQSLHQEKLIYTLLLGLPLFLAIRLLRESRHWLSPRASWLEGVGGAAFLLVHYFVTVDDSTVNYYLKYFQLSLALHLLVSFIAFRDRGDEEPFWRFNRTIFLRILLSVLYAGVFFGGLAIALVAVTYLFDFKIKGERYFELWLVSALVLQTWHFLAGVPKIGELKGEAEYPRGLRVFVQFLLIPLVSLYMVILYLYMTKILVTWNWPRGYIGWLVSVMSVLGIFNLLLISPERQKTESRWIVAYSRLYYVLILPLLGMLFIAIGKRISEYGVTEQRYFLLALGSLLAGLSIYFIFSATKSLRVIPFSLFCTATVTLVGPWSAYNISLWNQRQRVQKIMERNSLAVGDSAKDARARVSPADQLELSSIFDYLIKHHGANSVAKWFPRAKDSRADAAYFMDQLGLKFRDSWRSPTFYFRSDVDKAIFDIEGFNRAVSLNFQVYGSETTRSLFHEGKVLILSLQQHPARLSLDESGEPIATIPLDALVEKLRSHYGVEAQSGKTLDSDQMVVSAQNGPHKMKIYIQEMTVVLTEDNSPTIQRLEGLVLIR